MKTEKKLKHKNVLASLTSHCTYNVSNKMSIADRPTAAILIWKNFLSFFFFFKTNLHDKLLRNNRINWLE